MSNGEAFCFHASFFNPEDLQMTNSLTSTLRNLALGLLASVFTIASAPAHASATGVCELLEGTKIDTGFFNIFDSSADYSGGRKTYGTSFSSKLYADSETNGRMSKAISLRDDRGNLHTLAGDLNVGQVYMMKLPDGTSYVCLSVSLKDDVPGFAFRISEGNDIIDTPVDAATSGRGYGVRVLGQGSEYYYSSAKSQCTYSGPSEHICETDERGHQRCYDRQVDTTTKCSNGETETSDQGVEIIFGITDPAGHVVGKFTLIK
jgi:hypothetical protein